MNDKKNCALRVKYFEVEFSEDLNFKFFKILR